MKKFEIIVVGAGTGGCMTAKILAKEGFKVCLLDQKEAKSIGDKVCGDAIGKHHFDRLGLSHPKGEELERIISGIKVYSPDLKTVFRLASEGLHGFIIDRHVFGQKLLKEAMDAGADLLDSTQVSEPIIEDGFVKGVSTVDRKARSKKEFKGEITVDASGFSAGIRSKLPPEIGIDAFVKKEDVVVCYREIRELKSEMEEPGFCDIYLNLGMAPGGYYWIFPEDSKKVNVGLGVAGVQGFPNPKNQLYENVLPNPMFEGSRIIHGGGGSVPTRRPLDSFVGNGVVVIGDAACQVNPVHGGGMGPSMISGSIAANSIMEALEKGDFSQEALWSVNTRYMKTYGAKQAGLDVLRMFLQNITDEDLNYGMKYKLFKEEDVLNAGLDGNVHLNVSDATQRIFKGLGRFSFLKKLYGMARMANKVKALYQEYPVSPVEMPEWKARVQRLFLEAKKSL